MPTRIPPDVALNSAVKDPKFLARFHAKVRRGRGCWEWIASRKPEGYGEIGVGRTLVFAHRAAWTIANGPIPEGFCILHRCDNPPCCNPKHLFLGTYADNARDMMEKGRDDRGERPRGEEHALAKLKASDVLAIRAMKGVAIQRELAEQYGVSQNTISCVLRRKSWTHV